MRMPAISARAHIYATECKRRAPRLTVLPQGTARAIGRSLLLKRNGRLRGGSSTPEIFWPPHAKSQSPVISHEKCSLYEISRK